MAYSVRQERQGLATSLREDLAEAERLVVQLRRDNVETFLQLMDRIEESFRQQETSGLDLRPERTRWGSLLSKLRREAGRVMRTIEAAGGLERLREANPPAEGMWWRLDAVVAAARRRVIRRSGISVGTIAAALAVVWAILTYVIPPDQDTVVASEAITTLQQLSFEGRWQEALSIVEEAKSQLTQPDIELLIWEGVVRDKLGQSEASQEVLEEARALTPADRQVGYLWTLGSIRLGVNDLDEARLAGNEAVAVDPSNAQGYFLLAGVAETEGDTGAAIDLFEQAYQLATDSNNPQLAVIARVRMGGLLQRPAGGSLFGEEQPAAGESGGNGEAE